MINTPSNWVPGGSLLPLEARMKRYLAAVWESTATVSTDAADEPLKTIRGEFLSWLLVAGVAKNGGSFSRIDLLGARIERALELTGMHVNVMLRCFGCEFTHRIDLNDATIPGLELVACRICRVDADRLTTAGHFHVRRVYTHDPPAVIERYADAASVVTGHMRLNGANIR